MIASPLKNAVLEGDGLEIQQHELHNTIRFVGLVCEEPMRARCDAESTQKAVAQSCKIDFIGPYLV